MALDPPFPGNGSCARIMFVKVEPTLNSVEIGRKDYTSTNKNIQLQFQSSGSFIILIICGLATVSQEFSVSSSIPHTLPSRMTSTVTFGRGTFSSMG